jgi:putative molybdopterin biosynthesis protein
MKTLLSTKEVSRYLGVNEKMVYTLVAEKGLPASKVTGKWIFPQHLVDQWIEANTQNMPSALPLTGVSQSLLIMSGSNDPLLEQTISLYNGLYPENLAVFGNSGSMGGIRALKQGLCQVATSHLLQAEGNEYNFEFMGQGLVPVPVVVNFCRRQQGLIVAKDNPRKLSQTKDLGQHGVRVVNRKLGTGTRLLFDRELKSAGIEANRLAGYDQEMARHMDVGLAVLSGKADAGPGIKPIAERLRLDFIPWRWERYDLLILKDRFFDPVIQQFLGLLHEKRFRDLAADLTGYDLTDSGKMIFPPAPPKHELSLKENGT